MTELITHRSCDSALVIGRSKVRTVVVGMIRTFRSLRTWTLGLALDVAASARVSAQARSSRTTNWGTVSSLFLLKREQVQQVPSGFERSQVERQ
jgi:hypothetical protein